VVVAPGQSMSLHKHFHRAEHLTVLAGTALVTRDGETLLTRENESVDLPIGCLHRVANPGRIPLALIEVQAGSYLGDDDVMRVEDSYGRANAG
jgi:mannose-1-phosphate guanylyltransferase/mannose-6-phosphate isomerase